MILSFLNAKSRQTSKSGISNKYLKPYPRNNTLKSVALAVALSVYLFLISFIISEIYPIKGKMHFCVLLLCKCFDVFQPAKCKEK